MKKLLIILLAAVSVTLFSATASAKENLLDNELDLKTDRLNKEQGADNKTQSFIAEDRLFDTEMMEKVEHAKEVKEKKSEQEKSEYFLVEVPAVKEIDTDDLFVVGETVKVAQQEETASAVSSPPSLWPLILGTALLTVVALFLFHSRRKKRLV
ncbi:hypothetical protein I6N96_01825 [Enterococcus sp. BWM-S5]|uniref:Type VII secretion protein EssA n=1 Tax=Enterococcus larvae TaxID=2794352 RepID=A0ABS4CEG0_9ENTE|nr:hypothetical protein [Enterococcus larvae]MBP1045001.1 hypothetical protein [Enterococcus larvae]